MTSSHLRDEGSGVEGIRGSKTVSTYLYLDFEK